MTNLTDTINALEKALESPTRPSFDFPIKVSPLAIRTLLDAHASALRDAEKLCEALKKIAAIEDCYSGTDWQEIEEAREIDRAALTTNTKETE